MVRPVTLDGGHDFIQVVGVSKAIECEVSVDGSDKARSCCNADFLGVESRDERTVVS